MFNGPAPLLMVRLPAKLGVPDRVTVPAPAWINPPGAAPPAVFMTPPPSIVLAMTVLPAPLKVKSLMIVCSAPLTVSVFPPATVQDCGPPMYIAELKVTLSFAWMPPEVTVSEPLLKE